MDQTKWHYSLSKVRNHRDLENKKYSDTAFPEKTARLHYELNTEELFAVKYANEDLTKETTLQPQIINLIDVTEDDMIIKGHSLANNEVFCYIGKTTFSVIILHKSIISRRFYRKLLSSYDKTN